MTARPEAEAATITCCFIHLEFWCGCLVTARAKNVCIFHQSVHANSPAMLLFASSALSAGTQALPCVNPEPCKHPAQLSSTRSSWAALSQSRELDYPLALKLHPLSFPLGGGGMRGSAGDQHPDFPLVNQRRFQSHFDRTDGQLFWKTMDDIQDIFSRKSKLLWNF